MSAKSMLSKHLYKHRLAYLLWLIFFIPAVVWSMLYNPETAILFWNKLYQPGLTHFFEWSTRLGEGFGFLIALFWIGLSGTYRQLFGFITAALLTLLFVWFFKHIVFEDAIRPIVYLEQLGIDLPNRSSYTLNRKFSFPSGHTTAGFAYFFSVALYRPKQWEIIMAVCLGILTAYSRVYLAQHFVIDTAAGSVLGIFIATISYLLFITRQPWPGSFLDKNIFPRRA